MKIHSEPISIVQTVFRQTLAANLLYSVANLIGPMIDGAMIGHFFTADAVAAYGMVWPIIWLCSLIGSIIAAGSRSLYTQLLSTHKTDDANRIFTFANLLNLALSLLLVAVLFSMPEQIAVFLGAKGDKAYLKPLLVDYIKGYAFSAPLMNGAKILSSYMSLDSDNRRNILAVLCMTAADIAGDFVAVFVFKGGLFALAMATTIGYLVQLAVLFGHFLRKQRMLRYVFTGMSACLKYTGKLIARGTPSGLMRISRSVNDILINHILAYYVAGHFLAAYSVYKSVRNLTAMAYLAVAETVWMLSSVYYSEEDQKALDQLQVTAFKTGLVMTCAVGLVMFLLPNGFVRIYLSETSTAVFEQAVKAVRVLSISMPLFMVCNLFLDYLMGIKRLALANLYAFFLKCGCMVPCMWFMVSRMGGTGAWYAGVLCLLLMAVWAFVVIMCRSHGKGFAQKRLLLHEGFGCANGQELSLTAGTPEEVVDVSRHACQFCLENGFDERKAQTLALCVEEMGVNIVEHGFTDHTPHQIDIRLLIKEGEVILRIRDNCPAFNPIERFETMRSENDPARSIGIRLVMQMSKDVRYYNVHKTNDLIIRV